ncbi:hypothetical protein WCQ02_24725 [Paraburkholderia tropica]|uniref:hypothetical protein n=1 Tax=Paraburkholderia tropica TaxID=92647 RepID=UPI0030181BC7
MSYVPGSKSNAWGTQRDWPSNITASRVIAFLSAFAIALAIVPLAPKGVHGGLDPSWQYAINVAVSKNLVFGRDLIFTFGPLGSVYTQLYTPETYWTMVVGSATIAIGFCAGAALAFPEGRRWCLVLMLPIVAMFIEKDAVLAILALFLLFGCVRLTLPMSHAYAVRRSRGTWVLLAILSIAVGIVPLIKGSLSGVVLAEGVLSIVTLLRSRNFLVAVFVSLCAGLSMLIAWGWVGQPMSALTAFFISQSQIISGYTEAMVLPGPSLQIASFLVGVVLILGSLGLATRKIPVIQRSALTIGTFIYLFIQFKAGFIRQDSHTIIAAVALMLVAIITAAKMDFYRGSLLLIVSAILSFGTLPAGFNLVVMGKNLLKTGAEITSSLADPFDETHLAAQYEHHRSEIAKADPLPKVDGSVDVYPTELAAVFANGLNWAGRPIFQSYSVYTPSLDRINAEHLIGPHGPQHIFFEVAPVDGRLPSTEDAASWPILLSGYKITDYRSRFLQLDRNAGVIAAPIQTMVASGTYRLNEVIHVPQSDRPVIARVGISQSMLGRLTSVAFRSARMLIEVTTDDGIVHTQRYIPEMGQSGFVLSPYVGSTNDFFLMATGDRRAPRVTSVRFVAPHIRFWTNEFQVTFLKLDVLPQKNPFEPTTVKAMPTTPFDLSAAKTGGACFLDYLNDVPLGANGGNLSTDKPLRIQGWMVMDDREPEGAQALYVELKGEDGVRHYFATSRYPRNDVMDHFNDRSMAQPGFAASLDVAALSGMQSITYYGVRDGRTIRCPTGRSLVLAPSR